MIDTTLLIDTWMQGDCTIGMVYVDSMRLCFSLELPWRNNVQNVSCIPAGVYWASKYRSKSKGDVVLLHDVYNRSYIEIHAGNYTRQIEGCILVGDSIKFLDVDNTPDVTNSVNTLHRLLALLPEQFHVTVQRHY